ncbi:MAG: hypothetical protein IJV00_09760 [Clostridia bacterium]|nr:hypothetical protein [Clostridia bacterium]
MSLLSKLFGGDKNAEKAAKDLLSGLFGKSQNDKPSSPYHDAPESASPYSRPAQSASPSGFSWGEEMPGEENQFNFAGTYEQYFEHIFAEDFSACRFEKSYNNDGGKHRVVYTFFSGVSKALVVELMPESSESKKLRNECQKTGVPYLRFYYDHDGWWNTRSYVAGRIRGALKI